MSKRVMRFSATIGAAAVFVLLGACSKKEAAAPAAPAAPPAGAANTIKADASILDLMLDPIASNAEFLWNAVGSVSTATGTKDLAPSTDAEWAAVRQKAEGLMAAADLLATEGRVVAHPDQKLKDPPGSGDLTPAQVQVAIDKERAVFAGFAATLKAAGAGMVAAIDKRDVDAYSAAGGALDEACEACHQRYWYPQAPKPPGL